MRTFSLSVMRRMALEITLPHDFRVLRHLGFDNLPGDVQCQPDHLRFLPLPERLHGLRQSRRSSRLVPPAERLWRASHSLTHFGFHDGMRL